MSRLDEEKLENAFDNDLFEDLAAVLEGGVEGKSGRLFRRGPKRGRGNELLERS